MTLLRHKQPNADLERKIMVVVPFAFLYRSLVTMSGFNNSIILSVPDQWLPSAELARVLMIVNVEIWRSFHKPFVGYLSVPLRFAVSCAPSPAPLDIKIRRLGPVNKFQ